jgi:hypothetical protein
MALMPAKTDQTRQICEFERTLIRVALAHTGGRNTLTRKIQELDMESGGDVLLEG